MKCPECGKEMYPYKHYYIYDKEKNKEVEICRKCYGKRQIHRSFVKVQGKTRVID